jgi:hypothetical protein
LAVRRCTAEETGEKRREKEKEEARKESQRVRGKAGQESPNRTKNPAKE